MKRWALAEILVLTCASVYAQTTGIIAPHVVTTEYPPYSFKSGEQQRGYASDVLRALYTELGLRARIDELPLPRAELIATNEKNVIYYPVIRDNSSEQKFDWIGKISNQKIGLYKLRARADINIKSWEDARVLNIGTLIGSQLIGELRTLGFSKISPFVSSDVLNLKKLIGGRVDLVALDVLRFDHTIMNYNQTVPAIQRLDASAFELAAALPVSKGDKGIYIAVSKSTSSDTKDKIRSAFDRIMAEGRVIEVAHWWSNEVERQFVQIYKDNLEKSGYVWSDYMFEGGAGSNMQSILEKRTEIGNLPGAIQTYMGPAVREWAQKDTLVRLDEVARKEEWKKWLPPLINDMIRYNGHYIAAPVNIQRVNWVWINPAAFAQAKAKIPTNWPEFWLAADKLSKTGVVPLAIGAEAWQEGALFENVLLGVGGPTFYRKALMEFDPEALKSKTMVAVFEDFRKMKRYTDGRATGRSWTEAAQMVADGRAAMYIMGDWAKSVFKAAGKPYGNSGYMAIPVPGTDKVFLNNTDVFAFIKTTDNMIPAQQALAKTIMNPGIQHDFNILKGSIPARLGVPRNGYDEVSIQSMDALAKGEFLLSFNFRQTSSEKVHDDAVALIDKFWNTDMPAGDAAGAFARILAREQ